MKKKDFFNLKVSKPRNHKINFHLGKYRNDLRLTWPQAKRKYPLMKPYSDSDFDGTLNRRDCRPLNPAKDGIFAAIAGAIGGFASGSGVKKGWKKGMAKEGYKEWKEKSMKAMDKKAEIRRKRLAKLPSRIRKKLESIPEKTAKFAKGRYRYITSDEVKAKVRQVRAGAERLTGTEVTSKKGERKQARPGRPAGIYIHTSPITGQKVPATVYYKHIKRVRRGQRAVSERVDTSQAAVLARRGIPPEVARQIINRRQLAREGYVEQEQQQPVQAMPTQPIQNGTPMQEEVQQEVAQVPERIGGAYQNVPQLKYKVVRDIMTGRIRMVPLPPRERWVQQ